MTETRKSLATTCTDCDGRGWRTTIVVLGVTMDGEAQTKVEDRPCVTCDGTGNGRGSD